MKNIWRRIIGNPIGRAAAQSEAAITVKLGMPALSVDALSSVAYGPQALIGVLIAAGPAGLALLQPITLVIVLLLGILVLSYRQVIAAFPAGGGSYAVATTYFNPRVSKVTAASLIVDYVLTVSVSIAAGVDALVSAFPELLPLAVPIGVFLILFIALMNLRGIPEAARAFAIPTAIFIVSILAVAAIALFHPFDLSSQNAFHYPAYPATVVHLSSLVGVFLVLKAFSSGCSALTGIEAIANCVPVFREPRVKRAQQTELLLGFALGIMLLGLAAAAAHYHVQPTASQTVLSEITKIAVGNGWIYYLVSIDVTIVLALAANTSFSGLPVLLSLLGRDHLVPHFFSIRGDRLVFTLGIVACAVSSSLLLIAVGGNTNSLIPMYSIGVFMGFTVAQSGLVLHWFKHKPRSWRVKALLNGFGACLTAAAALIFMVSKFTEGAWVVAVTIPLLYLMFSRIHHYYKKVGEALAIGEVPGQLARNTTLVVVLVNNVSKLTAEALSDAVSFGDEVIALSVQFDEEGAEHLQQQWDEWKPGVRLSIIRSQFHSVVRPTLRFISNVETIQGRRVIVLIPEIRPRHRWHRLLHNQMGYILENALRRSDVVVARLGFNVNE